LYLNYDTAQTGRPEVMRKLGFIPVSTKGFYKNHPDNVVNKNNDPTIPIVIGDGRDTARALGWVDPGFNDRCNLPNNTFDTHVININELYLEHLKKKGIAIKVNKKAFILLDNRTKIPDTLYKCIFAKRYTFSVIGTHGEAVIPYSTDKCNVYLKINGEGGASVGGITTLKYPAAQFGGSILMDCDQITIDPYRSLVWFRQNEFASRKKPALAAKKIILRTGGAFAPGQQANLDKQQKGQPKIDCPNYSKIEPLNKFHWSRWLFLVARIYSLNMRRP
jgi:hypothetical protein